MTPLAATSSRARPGCQPLRSFTTSSCHPPHRRPRRTHAVQQSSDAYGTIWALHHLPPSTPSRARVNRQPLRSSSWHHCAPRPRHFTCVDTPPFSLEPATLVHIATFSHTHAWATSRFSGLHSSPSRAQAIDSKHPLRCYQQALPETLQGSQRPPGIVSSSFSTSFSTRTVSLQPF